MIIDGDAHVNEPIDVFEEFLEEPYRSRRPQLIKDTLGLTRIMLEGRLYPDTRLRQAHSEKVEGTKLGGTHPGASDRDARMDALAEEGFDAQVIFGSLGLALSTIRDADFRVAMSRACNDYYAYFCGVAPERLKCMATLPLPDVDSAVEEARRAVEELGHVGVTVPPNLDGTNLDDPSLEPLYAEVERLGVPLAVHWGNGSYLHAAGTERFDTHFMVHAIGHPFEQMIAVSSILCGGVLERYPGLRVAFLEAGCGWLPYWIERLDEHYERRGAEMPQLVREPSSYFTEGRCYVSAEPEEALVPALIDMLGPECVFFASDYPHSDSAFPESVRIVEERDDLTDEQKARILGANAAELYGIKVPETAS